MFKVNIKDTRTTGALFVNFDHYFGTYPSVSIVDFAQDVL